MKKALCSILFLITILKFSSVQAQILTVSQGTDLSVKQGTQFALDSLVLTPSSDFVLSNISVTRDTLVTFTANNPYIARVYKFSGNTNAFSGSIRMIYQDGAELNGLSESALQLNIHDASGWQAFTSSTNDIINNYVLSTSLSGIQLNEITLAASGFALPLQWRSFIATKQQQNVLLEWSTFSEQNTKTFTVQNSKGGILWNSLATVAAAGNSSSARNYNYLHTAPASGNNYYRIIETDIEERQNYSVVQKIFIAPTHSLVELLGNPVTNGMLVLRVNLTKPNDKAPFLKLYTNDGKLLIKQQAVAGINYMNVNGYAKDAYLLQANSTTIKFLIQ